MKTKDSRHASFASLHCPRCNYPKPDEVAKLKWKCGQCGFAWQESLDSVHSNAWLESWAWRAARHMRNTDRMLAAKLGVETIDILAELRDHDPDGYDREVKRSNAEVSDAR